MKRFMNIALFFVLVALGRLWIAVDQYLLPHSMLFPAFIVVICLLMSGYFIIIKPEGVRRFSLTLAGCTGVAVAALSLVQHTVLHHDFAIYWTHSLRLLIIASCLPLIIGGIYGVVMRRR